MPNNFAAQPDQCCFAGPALPDSDPGCDVPMTTGRAKHDTEDAGGMLVGCSPCHGHRVVSPALVDHDDQGHHHAHGRAAGMNARAHEL